MSTRRKPERLDLLAVEINELDRSKATLFDLYYVCGATEIAIEHLLRPYNPLGLDLKSLRFQLKNMKEILDGQMALVAGLNRNAIKGAEALKTLKDVEDAEIVDEVDRMCDVLLGNIEDLRPVILQVAMTCRGFHLACRLILDFLVEQYSEII